MSDDLKADWDWARRQLLTGRLPPWQARNRRERFWFELWTVERANEAFPQIIDAYWAATTPGQDEPDRSSERDPKETAIAAAHCGNIEPLLAHLGKTDPVLVPFIALPKRKRGDCFHRPGHRVSPYLLTAARCYIDMIRTVWAKHYNRRNRAKSPTALQIAALGGMAGVTAAEIREGIKRGLGRSR
jgi:hypothetical protein